MSAESDFAERIVLTKIVVPETFAGIQLVVERGESEIRFCGGFAELPRSNTLTGKVAALPGFEAVAKVAFPPLIALIEVPDFYFVGFRVLAKPVAKGEVPVKAHEFAKVNIGDSRITSNDKHILVIICCRSLTEVC